MDMTIGAQPNRTRRGLDGLRREANYRTKLAQLQWPVQPAGDERLRLIFT